MTVRWGRSKARGLAGTLAFVYLASAAATGLHFATISHVPCSHGGEWVHADGDHPRPGPAGEGWSREEAPKAAGHDDRHCALSSHVRSRAETEPAVLGGTRAPAQVPVLAATVDPRVPLAAAALSSAPKHSPPA